MQTPEPAKPPQLQRVLGPWMATAIVIGTVIGSGVFKKPHAVARDLTEFGMIMIAWVLVGLLALIGSLILAEVAVIHPRAGGNYVFLREGYGRWAGFLWGWVEFWIIRSGSIAALATVFAESLHDVLRFTQGAEDSQGVFVMPREVLGFWSLRGITIAVIVVLALVNMRGTVLGGGLQVVVTTVKVASLLTIAMLPFIFLGFTTSTEAQMEHLDPIWPEGFGDINWSKFLTAIVGIIWAYHGWMNLAPMAEEVKEPNRNLPLSFVMGTLAVIVLYCSVNVAYHLVVPREDMVTLGGNSPVATLFATRLLGSIGMLLASGAIMTSVFGSLNGNLLVGPRLLYAMGQDGLAPHSLCQLHPRWGTPAIAEMVLAAWSILLVVAMAIVVYAGILGKSIFDGLTDYAMFGAVSFETMAVASIFVCRQQYPVDKVKLPYRCWGYPWLPIFYVLVMAAVLVNMFIADWIQSLSALELVLIGAWVYLRFFANKSEKR
jgi:basic amino acid/polyamine antiporter, APA family